MSAQAALGGAGSIARRYHRFSSLEIAGLFVRYQAYSFLLLTLAAAPLVLVAVLAPTRWWAWLIAAPISLKVGSFALFVAGRWRGKVRVTAVAQRRIDAGRFKADMVEPLCGDPCFRVVAAEILRRGGMDKRASRALISSFKAEHEAQSGQTLIIDHTRGTVTQVDGNTVTQVTGVVPQTPSPAHTAALPSSTPGVSLS